MLEINVMDCPVCGHHDVDRECPSCGEILVVKRSKPRSRIRDFLFPTIVGMFFGMVFFSPFLRTPGDSQSQGAGLGGLLGLAIGIAIRIWKSQHHNSSER